MRKALSARILMQRIRQRRADIKLEIAALNAELAQLNHERNTIADREQMEAGWLEYAS